MPDLPGTLKSSIVPPPARPWEKALGIPSREPLRRARKARERHRMVVYLHCSGWTNNQIAEALGYSANQISVIINSQHPDLLEIKKMAQHLVLERTTDVMLRFRQESMKSVDTLVLIRDLPGEDAKIVGQRRLAARDILDRAGYSVVHKQLNVGIDIPAAALEASLEKIEEANEVESRRAEWKITNPDEIEVKRATA